jgi:hypothetical protein
MPTNEEIQKRIIDTIKAKVGKTLICPLCGHNVWSIGDRYAVLSASEHPTELSLGGKIYPTIPITCAKCGNIHLINLKILGFTPEDWDSLRLSKDG